MRTRPLILGASVLGVALFVQSRAHAQATVGITYTTAVPDVNATGIAVTGILHPPPGDGQLSTVSSGEASADLTAGTMRAYSRGVCATTATQLTSISAGGGVSDTITIAGPAGNVKVMIGLAIDGRFTENVALLTGQSSDARVTSTISASPANNNGTPVTSSGGYDRYATGGQPTTYKASGSDTVPVGNPGDDISYTQTITASIPVGAPWIIGATLSAQAFAAPPGGDTYADFGNTARLTITLPAGYTFTSASGVFLSEPGAPGLSLDGGSGGPDGGGTSSGGTSGGGTSGGGTSGGGTSGGIADDGGSSGGSSSGGSKGGCNVSGPVDPTMLGFGGLTIVAVAALMRGRRRREKAKPAKK